MDRSKRFTDQIKSGYKFKGESLIFGGAMLDGNCVEDLLVKAPLKMFNRHGLIAGATGTGKTKTLQVMTEGLSEAGVPVLLMDMKGDLSGLAAASEGHPKIDERHAQIGIPFNASGFPLEFLTISGEKGTRLRATVSEFGPVLLSKILDLNNTQSGIVSMVFKYCDDRDMPLLDLKDFKKVLQYAIEEGKPEFKSEYGHMSTSSVGAIMRSIITLEQQGADQFFGEISFDVEDLVRTDDQGKGIVSVLRLTDIQDKPQLFSTFMLCLLAEVYATFPESGDSSKPKLVIFIDEAHLVFQEASKALLSQLNSIVKLIRSKGVGLYFCTQLPTDIPDTILSQLGLKVQHALRAFTAKDRKAIKLTAQNYPDSPFYDTSKELTQLGIGEALITALNDKGIPTPLARTLLVAPRSRMDVLTKKEIKEVLGHSMISDDYNKDIDRKSAYEILNEKILEFKVNQEKEEKKSPSKSSTRRTRSASKSKSFAQSTTGRRLLNTVVTELTRGLLGVLGVKSSRRRINIF